MSVTTEQAAVWFADRAKNTPMPGARAMFEIAATALREKAEREDPKPLTLEEALSAEDPIWIKKMDGTNGKYDDWGAICDGFRPGTIDRKWMGTDEEDWLSASDYGKTWIAYRNKPKEVNDECSK